MWIYQCKCRSNVQYLTPNSRPCVGCAVTRVLDSIGPNEVVIVITGSPHQLTNHEAVTKQVSDKSVPVYIISYPPTIHTSYLKLAKFGQVYAVAENSATIHPLIHLQVHSILFLAITIIQSQKMSLWTVLIKEHCFLDTCYSKLGHYQVLTNLPRKLNKEATLGPLNWGVVRQKKITAPFYNYIT